VASSAEALHTAAREVASIAGSGSCLTWRDYGTQGENTRKAITAFADMKGLEPTDQPTEELWRALTESEVEPALVSYKITGEHARSVF
jgi:hypothetical protein